MATTTMTDEVYTGWKGLICIILRTFNFKPFRTTLKAASSACGLAVELKQAVRTISMAANPGETYGIVAARIEREAAAYKRFLQHRQPIGTIALNVKELDAQDDDAVVSCQQYHVKHPSEGQKDKAEGRASICYRFNRSNRKVLEFVVHDEKDQPLFSIARTYSNWIGRKTFNLGFGRTFYLHMVQVVPGYVNVEAGFVPPKVKWSERVAALAGRLVGNGGRTQTALAGMAFRRPLVVSSLLVTLVFSLVFWRTLANTYQTPKTIGNKASQQATEGGLKVATDESIGSETARVLQVSGSEFSLNVPRSIKKGSLVKGENTLQAKRLATVQEVLIFIDKSSCDDSEDRCHELLTSVQKGVESKLSGLSLPVPVSDPETSPARNSLNLVVSYEPMGQQCGNVLLTLYDQDGSLWAHKGDFNYDHIDQSQFVKAYADEASWDIVREILLAREQISFGHSDNSDKGLETRRPDDLPGIGEPNVQGELDRGR